MTEHITPLTFILEVLPENPSDADPALVSALGRDISDLIRVQGETVEPIYTGERGGKFLAQVATLLTTAWEQRETILGNLSAAVSTLTALVETARRLRQVYERRVGKYLAQQHPLAITIELHDITMKVEVTDRKSAVEIATELAQHLQVESIEGQTSTRVSTPAKIRAEVPKRPTRKRR